MDTRDHIIFMLSTDWFYLNKIRMRQMSLISRSDHESIKQTARNFVKQMLKQARSYFELDFSEDRIARTYERFCDEVVFSVDKKSKLAIKDLLNFLPTFGEKYSKESWLISLSYLKLSEQAGSSIENKMFEEALREVEFLEIDEIYSGSVRDEWSKWLNSFFEENENEILDFYCAVVAPIFIVGNVALNIAKFEIDKRVIFFEKLESVIFSEFGISLSKEKIKKIHEQAAQA